jgi:hypothetical protein
MAIRKGHRRAGVMPGDPATAVEKLADGVY